MVYSKKSYISLLIKSIEKYQDEHLMSEREISQKAGLSPTMISKIKKGTTVAKLSTLRKLKEIGVNIPKPNRDEMEAMSQMAKFDSLKIDK